MKKVTALLDFLTKRLFSSTYQIQRIVILTGIALVLAVVSFGGYYYYDRYYRSQPKVVDVSIAQAEQAVQDNPSDPVARLNLAETYMVYQRFDDAIEQTQTVMQAYPDNQNAWFLYGIASALNGDTQNAVEPLQKYVDANKDAEMAGLNKRLQSAAYYLGDSYLKLEQPDKAIPSLELAVGWNRADADAMYKLGVAYGEVQEFDKALYMLHQATAFVPNFKEAYEAMVPLFEATNELALVDYARGMTAYSEKDYSTALELLLKAVQGKPDSAPVFSGLGMTYEALNDLPNAKTSYETALQLDPNDFAASNGLKRVEILLAK